MSDLILLIVGAVLLAIIITVIITIIVSVKKRKEEADFQLPDLEENSNSNDNLRTMTSNIPTTIESVDEDSILDIIKSNTEEDNNSLLPDDNIEDKINEPEKTQKEDFKLPEFDVEKAYEYKEDNIIEDKVKHNKKKKPKKSKTGDGFLDVFNEMEEVITEGEE